MRAPEPVTWDALEKVWLADRLYSGPSEKYDHEQDWLEFRAEHEKSMGVLIGFADVARIAGVTRQRARQFVKSPGFPAVIHNTSYGPLYRRDQVEEWARARNTKPGPRKGTS